MIGVARVVLVFAALAMTHRVVAQTTLGAILEAGAKPISAAQFREELVQRIITGPTATGGSLEIMYAENGTVHGRGLMRVQQVAPPGAVAGEWRADDVGRICTSMLVGGTASTPSVALPMRCQYWFKLDDKYFFADSDVDRSAKVLSRTIKP